MTFQAIDFSGNHRGTTPSACPECSAVSGIEADHQHPGIWNVYITHADGCPALRLVAASWN